MQQLKSVFELRGLTLVPVAGAWLLGILLESAFDLLWLLLCIGAVGALLAVILLWNDRLGRLTLLVVLFLLIGAARCALASPAADLQTLAPYLHSAKVQIRGSVTDEPKLEGHTRLLAVDISGVRTSNSAPWQDIHGQLEVQMLAPSSLTDPYGANYGDTVELQGRLAAPLPHSAPNVIASMAFPRLSVGGNDGNLLHPFIAAFYQLRITLATLISQSLPQPEAALFIAILLSLRTPALIPLIQAFNVTGTAHLIAPSGFKVTLLAGLVTNSTSWLYENPKQSEKKLLPAQKRRKNRLRWITTALVTGCLVVYTLLSGSGPAALRAGIMGILLVLAPRLGRIYNAYTALALTALLLSSIDPFILWNAGFQLSFAGTLGIVLLTPFFQRLFHPLTRILFDHLTVKTIAATLAAQLGYITIEIIAVTLAAQTATLPIFALTFNQISFIAPLALLCGWILWPLLWYIRTIVLWCAILPDAYTNATFMNGMFAWCYYGILTIISGTILYKWPLQQALEAATGAKTAPLSKRAWQIVQICTVIIMLLGTGITALAASPDGQLHILFFSVGPAGKAPQGEAIFVSTPDGKTALIDGGLDATSLGQVLDSHLPFWQRSLDMVILTTPRSDHLAGLQDIITRYQVGQIIDAGMLHPNTGYALWRRTISERNFHYTPVQQGTTLMLGSQVAFQILSPASPLHKGSNEELDNTLVARLAAPGFSLLLLGSAASSSYALGKIEETISSDYLHADVVQLVAEENKAFPTELSAVLQSAHPSFIVATPALTPRKHSQQSNTIITSTDATLALVSSYWQIGETAQMGTMELRSNGTSWNINATG